MKNFAVFYFEVKCLALSKDDGPQLTDDESWLTDHSFSCVRWLVVIGQKNLRISHI
jgi:hypothetical protein